jgi:hypothetical protein
MGSEARETAELLIKSNLSVIPIKEDKRPVIDWKPFQDRIANPGELNFNGRIALVCGPVSGNVEAIDIDSKYDITGTLIERFQDLVNGAEPFLFSKLVIQKTPSGGLHLVYRCSVIEGNKKLASRNTTEEERKANVHDKIRVLIETRGAGGYIAIDPTPGYSLVNGSFDDIQEITPEERNLLLAAARSLNEVTDSKKLKADFQPVNSSLKPWDDFNSRTDADTFLTSHGWTWSHRDKHREYYCRPGKTIAQGHSGSWTPELQRFFCYTSSTELTQFEPYTLAALYAFFECNGDFAEAGKRLYSLGYGERSSTHNVNLNGHSKEEGPKHPTGLNRSTTAKEVDIKAIWDNILITEEPPEEIALMKIGGVPAATVGNHSLIVGKKKARKTLFIVWLLSQYSGNIETDILFFDTEQGKKHVYLVRKKLLQLTGKTIPVFYLRGKTPQERQQIILETVKQWPTRPKLIVIDGIRDLLSNINDPDQSTDLIVWLETLTVDFGLHVINVLHLNKTDGNARGHIGSELLNKAEITIEIEKDEQAGCSIVKCESSRDQPFETFAFTHSSDGLGLPELVSKPIKGEVLTIDDQKSRLRYAFDAGVMKYADVVEAVKSHFCVGGNKAKALIAGFHRDGWIVKAKNEGDKYPTYKIMI